MKRSGLDFKNKREGMEGSHEILKKASIGIRVIINETRKFFLS